jgi:hypothetical protein
VASKLTAMLSDDWVAEMVEIVSVLGPTVTPIVTRSNTAKVM